MTAGVRFQQEIDHGGQPARFFAERGVLLPPAPVEPPAVYDDGILIGVQRDGGEASGCTSAPAG